MRKTLSLVPVLIAAFAFFTLPAHAQFDTGTDWKLNQVQDVNYLTGGCDEDMSADECFASGTAQGMTSCTAYRCVQCGNDVNTGKAGCYAAPRGINGVCKCTLTTKYLPDFQIYVTVCEGTGACKASS